MKIAAYPCPQCGDVKVFDITERQMEELKVRQKHIQYILPDFSAEDRERFVSGMCPTCWDAMWEEK